MQTGTEADWRADLRDPIPEWRAGVRVLWLRQHRIEQGDRCHYCGCRFSDGWDDPWLVATLDHVIARAHGGETSFENLVAACKLCNTAKGSMTLEEARILLPHRRVALLNRIQQLEKRRKDRTKRRRRADRRRLSDPDAPFPALP